MRVFLGCNWETLQGTQMVTKLREGWCCHRRREGHLICNHRVDGLWVHVPSDLDGWPHSQGEPAPARLAGPQLDAQCGWHVRGREATRRKIQSISTAHGSFKAHNLQDNTLGKRTSGLHKGGDCKLRSLSRMQRLLVLPIKIIGGIYIGIASTFSFQGEIRYQHWLMQVEVEDAHHNYSPPQCSPFPQQLVGESRSGKSLGIISWDPSVSKSNRLHVDDILSFFFMKLGYIL